MESSTCLDEPIALRSFHGKHVHLAANDTVKTRRSASQQPLQFRLSTAKAKEILVLKEIPRLCLTLEAVQLCVQKSVVSGLRSGPGLPLSRKGKSQNNAWPAARTALIRAFIGYVPGGLCYSRVRKIGRATSDVGAT